MCQNLISFFLDNYDGHGVVSAACRRVGGWGVGWIGPNSVHAHLRKHVLYSCVTHGMLRCAICICAGTLAQQYMECNTVLLSCLV